LVNRLFAALTQLGLGARYRYMLTVRGRRTGREYSTPVDVLEVDGKRWLVAGYGIVNWVHNVRANGEVTLSRRRHTEHYRAIEVHAPEAVPVLRAYMREIRVTAPYFDANADSPEDAIRAELSRHPVFRLAPSVESAATAS
jgi:deazaflavin-dependent oxidoreductase (nitroreductase family)